MVSPQFEMNLSHSGNNSDGISILRRIWTWLRGTVDTGRKTIHLPDIINASFELGGALTQTLNIKAILADRKVMGVSWLTTLFFSVWGIWNLYFYSDLQQWFSLGAGMALTVTNLLWVFLVFYFKKMDDGN
jgi:hypothetical protein